MPDEQNLEMIMKRDRSLRAIYRWLADIGATPEEVERGYRAFLPEAAEEDRRYSDAVRAVGAVSK